MTLISCSDYGFECEHIMEGDSEDIVEEFTKHCIKKHGEVNSKKIILEFLTNNGFFLDKKW